MSKQIIILGSSGFIGSNLLRSLMKDNKKIKGYNSKSLNLLNRKKVKQKLGKLKNKTVLIICSAIISKNSINSISNNKNIKMIENIIKYIDKQKIIKLIFLSSVDVYPKYQNFKITEKTTPQPETNYGLSKLECEKKLNFFCKSIPLLIFRLPGVYGPGDKFKKHDWQMY